MQVDAQAGRQLWVAHAAPPQPAVAAMAPGSFTLGDCSMRNAKPAAASATPCDALHGRHHAIQPPPAFPRTAVAPGRHAARRAVPRGRLCQRAQGLRMRPFRHQDNKLRATAALHADACLAGAAACRAAAAAGTHDAGALPWHYGCMPCITPGASSGDGLQLCLKVLVHSPSFILKACIAFAGDSMNVPLAPGLCYTIEVARRTGISMPACGGSPPLPGPSAGSTARERVQAESGAVQVPGSTGTAPQASNCSQGPQEIPICPPMPQPAAGPLVNAAPLASACSESTQPLPDPDRLARMQPLSPILTAVVSGTDPEVGAQGALGESRLSPYSPAVNLLPSPGQRAGTQHVSPTSPGAANAGALWGLGVQGSTCADLAGCVDGLQRCIARLSSSHLSGLQDSSARLAELENTAGLPCLQSGCQDASGSPAGSSAAALPHRRNYESTRAGDANSDAEDIRCKGALRCASCAGILGRTSAHPFSSSVSTAVSKTYRLT